MSWFLLSDVAAAKPTGLFRTEWTKTQFAAARFRSVVALTLKCICFAENCSHDVLRRLRINVHGKWKENFIDADFFERTRSFFNLSDTAAAKSTISGGMDQILIRYDQISIIFADLFVHESSLASRPSSVGAR